MFNWLVSPSIVKKHTQVQILSLHILTIDYSILYLYNKKN